MLNNDRFLAVKCTKWLRLILPLLSLAQKQDQLDYIVILDQNDDLTSRVANHPWKKNKGRMVYSHLKTMSDLSQAGLTQWLFQNKITYTAFFIANCVQVKSNIEVLKT